MTFFVLFTINYHQNGLLPICKH